MSSNETTFVLTVPLKIEKWQKDYLKKVFRQCEIFYNDLRRVFLNRYKDISRTKQWRSWTEEIKEINKKLSSEPSKEVRTPLKEKRVDLYKKRNDILSEYKFSKFGFQGEANRLRKKHYDLIDSTLSYTIAGNLWVAFDDYLYGTGKTIRWKRKDSMKSIANFWSNSGLRIVEKEGKYYCVWGKRFRIPLMIDGTNSYEVEAMRNKIKYCRIKRFTKNEKDLYYCQLTFGGVVPSKIDAKTGEFLRMPGEGKVEVTISSGKVDVKTEDKETSYPLAAGLDNSETFIQELDQKIENSRRINNPQNYNENGTIKKGRKHWHNSKRYYKLTSKRRNAYRVIQTKRKIEHETLANRIISMGDDFVIYINYPKADDLKKDRKKKPLDKAERKFHLDRGAAEFTSILERKIGYHPCSVKEVNTYGKEAV